MNSILLISENRTTVRQVKSAVAKAAPECQIRCAAKREELAGAAKPAVIILDLTMTDEPATELLKWLRRDGTFREVPVFALGSDALKTEIEEAYSLGVSSCLSVGHGTRSFEPIAGSIATYASLISDGLSPACA
jgi:CheY-like chemotaxis protein